MMGFVKSTVTAMLAGLVLVAGGGQAEAAHPGRALRRYVVAAPRRVIARSPHVVRRFGPGRVLIETDPSLKPRRGTGRVFIETDPSLRPRRAR